MLENIYHSPGEYTDDPVWGELARLLSDQTARPKTRFVMKKTVSEFKIYGKENIDIEAIRQMETAMKLPVAVKGALMADAHVGYGLPIGGVVAAYNAVIPYGVGMDIGCRMCMSVFVSSPDKIKNERERITKALLNETRFGLAEFHDIGNHEILERKEFREIRFLRSLYDKFARQLGTSGHGNHFVDVGYLEIKEYNDLLQLLPNTYFAILSHSGSRNFGAEVCKHYTKVAKEKLELKGEAGHLAWLELDSEEGQEYWRAMNLAGDYSHVNHRIIHERLAAALGEKPLKIIENHHNFAWKEELFPGEELIIHRKGATPAGKNDVGIIPGTMSSPAFIVRGKGNEESLRSAAHGAGRVISRRKARKIFSENQMKSYLQNKGITLLGGGIDESPMAYKDIHQVMRYQEDLVEEVGIFYPKIVRME